MRQHLITFALAMALIGGLFGGLRASAQEAEAPAEQRRYAVEIILFRYGNGVPNGNERFLPEKPDDPIGLDGELLDDDVPVFGDIPATPLPAAEPEEVDAGFENPEMLVELTVTPRDQLQLDEVYGRLQRLDAYEPVLWTGWSQIAAGADLSPTIPLQRLGAAPADFDGTLQLYLSRFLHLVVDLTLTEQSEDLRPASRNRSMLPVRMRIDEDRIMKNGDLRYYDHPRFGLLAKVVRLDGVDNGDGIDDGTNDATNDAAEDRQATVPTPGQR